MLSAPTNAQTIAPLFILTMPDAPTKKEPTAMCRKSFDTSVRETGFEPARGLPPLGPQSRVSIFNVTFEEKIDKGSRQKEEK